MSASSRSRIQRNLATVPTERARKHTEKEQDTYTCGNCQENGLPAAELHACYSEPVAQGSAPEPGVEVTVEVTTNEPAESPEEAPPVVEPPAENPAAAPEPGSEPAPRSTPDAEPEPAGPVDPPAETPAPDGPLAPPDLEVKAGDREFILSVPVRVWDLLNGAGEKLEPLVTKRTATSVLLALLDAPSQQVALDILGGKEQELYPIRKTDRPTEGAWWTCRTLSNQIREKMGLPKLTRTAAASASAKPVSKDTYIGALLARADDIRRQLEAVNKQIAEVQQEIAAEAVTAAEAVISEGQQPA